MSLLLLLCAAILAQSGPSVPGRQIVGLLELPRVFGQPAPDGPPGAASKAPGGPVRARAARDAKSKVVARLAQRRDLISTEYAYEAPAAVVVGTAEGWYEVVLSSGTGWVAAADAGAFHPVEDLLSGHMSFMTDAWDRKLYDDLDGRSREIPAHLRQAKVHGARRKGGRLWLDVEVRMMSGCEGAEPPPGERGWVPAARGDGVPNAWFHSRGC